jgi:C-terminal processing protease CtpA/Prc
MYDPRENTSARDWTASPVSGSRLADVPIYVLSSSQTFSAAEYFAYNLKMLKRATIVGETTRGGQHSGVFQRINGHFGVAVQEVAAINPFPVQGWEIIGVEPDVKVPRREALDAAMKLAESRRRGPSSLR